MLKKLNENIKVLTATKSSFKTIYLLFETPCTSTGEGVEYL